MHPSLHLPPPVAHSRRSLRAIQGSRFIIGLALFVVHALAYARLDGVSWPQFGDVIVNAGRAGVAFFFALSGFLLTIAAARRLASGNPVEQRRFWGARLSSLWPIHLVGLAMMLPVYVPGLLREPLAWGSALALNAAMLHAFVPFEVEGIHVTLAFNTPSWSLSVLVLCYSLFPFIIARAFGERGWSRRRWVVSAAALWMTVLCGAWALGDSELGTWAFHYFAPVRFVDFFAGMALGALWLSRAAVADTASRMRDHLLELGVVIAWVLVAVTAQYVPAAVAYASWNVPMVLCAIWVLARGRGMVSHLLASEPMQRMGDLTLAFAMLHFPLTYAATLVDLYVRLGVLAASALLFVVSLLLAIVANRFVEEPARRHIRGRIDARWPAPRPVTRAVPIEQQRPAA